jgi:uncharacterized protein (DUF362 family)
MMKKIKVNLTGTDDPYEGVARSIGGLDDLRLNVRGARVLVKPNICSPFPPQESPSNTHPEVIGAVVRYLKEKGAQKVLVGDEPVWGLSSRLCYEKSGVKTAVEREGAEPVFFEEGQRVKKKIHNGRIFQSISLPAVLDEVDLLVNVPKMKTNAMTLITLCVKNLLGLTSFKDRKRAHRGIDLSYALIDIAKVVKPDLNLVDAISASEGVGAHEGTSVELGLLIASRDMVAADIVGAQVMGFDPMEIVTNQLALKEGLGIKDIAQIEVAGKTVDEFKTSFRRPFFRLVHPAPNVEVIPGGICPGCTSRVLRIPPKVDADKQYGVLIGIRPRFPRNRAFDEIWCFGTCGIEAGEKIAARYPHLKKRMKKVKGCPPLDWWCEHTIKVELKEKGWIK